MIYPKCLCWHKGWLPCAKSLRHFEALWGTPCLSSTSRIPGPQRSQGAAAAKKTPSDKTKSAFGHFFDWRCILRSIILIISILASTSFSSPILSSTWAQRPLLTVALITMVPCSRFRRIALHTKYSIEHWGWYLDLYVDCPNRTQQKHMRHQNQMMTTYFFAVFPKRFSEFI